MQILNCNNCNKDFILKQEEADVGQGITKHYFTCSHCKKEYLINYSSASIQAKQKRLQGIADELAKYKNTNPEKALNQIKKYRELKKDIGREVNKLEERAGAWQTN